MTHDVVIVGAGPIGLFLACELRLTGVAVLVLERACDPTSPLKGMPFGLRGLSVPTVEALHRRGLLGTLAAPEEVGGVPWMQQARRPGGHFAGIPFHLDRVDPARWPWHLPGPAARGMAVTMESLETRLSARALELGAEIRRGCVIDAVEPSHDEVILRAGGQTLHTRWLVGCDGGRSTVRKAGGFAFPGTDPEFTGYSVMVEVDDPAVFTPGRHYTATGMYTYAAPGTIAMVDYDGGASHRAGPVTLEHVQAVLRRVSGKAVTLTALHLATTWTDRAHQAATYRQGQMLLAGDAAHIHSPLGGQGLNLGIGDAMNLGWKLAATIRGTAPPDLLDSYERERHPVGAQVLDWSRAQVAIMRPSPASRALVAIVRDVIDTGDGATYFAGRVWGVSQRYDLGGDHPLVGHSMPDFVLADGSQAGEHLRQGKGLMLDFAALTARRDVVRRWADRITYLASMPKEPLGLNALLVRPDGVVAWAADTAVGDPLEQAAARWFNDDC